MYRSGGLIALFGFIFFISCEKCKRCEYSYTKTTIVQTVNGEQEVTTTYKSVIIDNTLADTTFDTECSKENKFTIEDVYINYGINHTELDNYSYICKDL